MKGFFYHDLCMGKGAWILTGVFGLVWGTMMVVGRFSSGYILLPIYVILSPFGHTLFEAERHGWGAVGASVPDGRQKMVQAKYRILLLLTAVALCMNSIFALLMTLRGKLALQTGLQVGLLGVGLALLLAEINLPLRYWFGFRDGPILTVMSAVLLVGGGGVILYKYMQRVQFDPMGFNILALLPLAALLFLYPSYRSSLNGCMRKDY